MIEESKIEQIKTYKIWSRTFLILGLISLIDVGTKSIVQQQAPGLDFGLISFGLLLMFNYLFGLHVASMLTAIISTIFGFSLLWFIPAYTFNKRAKTTENPTATPEKNYKMSRGFKTVSGIAIFVFVLLVLFGFFL